MTVAINKALAVLLAAGLAGSVAQASTFEIDASHSTIGFTVRHMVVANVRGSFETFTGHLELDESNPTEVKASASIQTGSINTQNQKRDDHLRNPDFFDAENNPTITFETIRSEGTWPNMTLVGNLTIKGVTKEISLPVEFSGPITDPYGNLRIGLSGSTSINRQEFGVSWSKSLDGGGLVVSDTVKIEIDAEAIKK